MCLTATNVLLVLLDVLSIYQRYSRKILWLKLSPTNKEASVIVKYYLDVVGEIGGVCKLNYIPLTVACYFCWVRLSQGA